MDTPLMWPMRLRLIALGTSLALLAVACGHDNDGSNNGPGNPPASNPDAGPDADTPSTHDIAIHAAANDAQFLSPFDATPDPEGKLVYFTAMTADGPAVFRVAAGGGNLTRLFVGEPLVSPFSIAISDDGAQLFIADAATESDTEERGAVFALPVGGGTPSVVSGTAGTTPRGIELNGDKVYFSGNKDGVPSVFTMPLGGGPTALVSGDPLRDPSGIAVAKSGVVYVLDTSAADSGLGSVIAIDGGATRVVASQIMVGFPGGLALSADEKTLLVSALDAGNATDAVVFVDVASGDMKPFTTSIDQFTEAAGLHRARHASVFAWADLRANGGTVFVLQ